MKGPTIKNTIFAIHSNPAFISTSGYFIFLCKICRSTIFWTGQGQDRTEPGSVPIWYRTGTGSVPMWYRTEPSDFWRFTVDAYTRHKNGQVPIGTWFSSVLVPIGTWFSPDMVPNRAWFCTDIVPIRAEKVPPLGRISLYGYRRRADIHIGMYIIYIYIYTYI